MIPSLFSSKCWDIFNSPNDKLIKYIFYISSKKSITVVNIVV